MFFTLAICTVLVLAQGQQDCGEKPPQRPWDGVRDNTQYIVAGRDAEKGAWPWQVSLQYYNEDLKDWRHTCGAVLIHEQWVLTAAHCTEGRHNLDFRVVLGGHNIKDYSGQEQMIQVDQIVQHPNFSMNTFLGVPNDICLLHLSKLADLSKDSVALACIPTSGEGEFEFTGNENCWITGWGLTKFNEQDIPAILQEASVPVMSNAECKLSGIIMLRDTHICAGNGKPTACSGDSGGPMSCKVGDKWYLAGVTSFGDLFCSLLPAVYTRVSSYHSWIMSVIG